MPLYKILQRLHGHLIFASVILACSSFTANSAPADFTLKSLVTESIAPSRFVNLGSGRYFIEFPKAAFGTVDITITATATQTVTLNFGEKKTGDAVNMNPGQDVEKKTETLQVTSGTKKYRITQHPNPWVTAQVDKLFPTIPFRYLELSNCPGTLTAADINQITVHYPFNDSASYFTSSDTALNAVWDLCKYSLKATSFLGIYVDGNRERGPYEADAYIQMLGHYSMDTQAYAIARNSFAYLLKKPTWPAEWMFHSIYGAYAEYMWTGDKSFLDSNYPTLQTKTLEKYARTDGLIHPTGTPFNDDTPIVDWPDQYRDGYQFGTYASSLNAQYYKALVIMGKIASALGKTADSIAYASKAAKVFTSFNSVYWNGSTYKDNPNSTHTAIHAAAYALDAEIVPTDRIASVASLVKSRGQVASVYGIQYVIDGLYKAGEENYALSLMASTTPGKSWYGMISGGSTITTEAFDLNYGDWNHAWGTAPANLIPRGLLGIEPITSGFGKIQIRPQIGTLSKASVTIPTIKGSVSVSVIKDSIYKITTTIPAGATAKVYVKDYNSRGTTVKVDGINQTGIAEGTFIVFDNITSGTHTFEKVITATTTSLGSKFSIQRKASPTIFFTPGTALWHIPAQWNQLADEVVIFNYQGVVLGKENIVGKNTLSGSQLQNRYGNGIILMKPVMRHFNPQ